MFNNDQPKLYLPAVDKDQFQDWYAHTVTQHLLKDLERTYMDCMIDPLPTDSMEKLSIMAIKREAYREFVDQILTWTPEGVDDGQES